MLTAQWTHRYPKVAGYRRHIYLEGYELPVMGSGPTDPAPSPDGKTLAVASSVGIHLYDINTLTEVLFIDTGVEITSLVFAPDGRIVASGSRDGMVQLWQVGGCEGLPDGCGE